MGLLRRLLGGKEEQPHGSGDDAAEPAAPGLPQAADDDPPHDEDEVERERALLRADAERLDDELLQRQLRYADRSWTPARQGGQQRADDKRQGSG